MHRAIRVSLARHSRAVEENERRAVLINHIIFIYIYTVCATDIIYTYVYQVLCALSVLIINIKKKTGSCAGVVCVRLSNETDRNFRNKGEALYSRWQRLTRARACAREKESIYICKIHIYIYRGRYREKGSATLCRIAAAAESKRESSLSLSPRYTLYTHTYIYGECIIRVCVCDSLLLYMFGNMVNSAKLKTVAAAPGASSSAPATSWADLLNWQYTRCFVACICYIQSLAGGASDLSIAPIYLYTRRWEVSCIYLYI